MRGAVPCSGASGERVDLVPLVRFENRAPDREAFLPVRRLSAAVCLGDAGERAAAVRAPLHSGHRRERP